MASPDDVPPFHRCGNTDFWRPKGQTNDDMTVTFVDPVGMVVLTTSRESQGKRLVLRGWFQDFYPELFEELGAELPTKESEPLSSWIQAIMKAMPVTPKKDLLRDFAKLHPESQRRLISGILRWLAKVPKGWKGDRRDIGGSDLPALWKLLNSAGIHEC